MGHFHQWNLVDQVVQYEGRVEAFVYVAQADLFWGLGGQAASDSLAEEGLPDANKLSDSSHVGR